jgi:hypothetical protein
MSLVVTTNNGKQFEKPNSGMFHGILADIVELGPITTSFNGQSKTQEMVRFVWFLNINGTDGKQLSVTARYGVNLHEKSNLYKAVKQIIGGAPSLTFDLATLIGSVRQLFIVRDIQTDSNGQVVKDFANIQGVAPAQPGVTVGVPSDFVRDINKSVADQARNKKKQQFTQAPQRQNAAAPQAAGFYQPPAGQPAQADVKF